MRVAEIVRKTSETDIRLRLELDGTGASEIDSGVGFLDHMLTLFARHGGFDLTVRCTGDTQVDGHHSVEDVGICLGQAFDEALGNRSGINRYGDIMLPMDEALILAAADISGRGWLEYDAVPGAQRVGEFDTELAEEFFIAFTRRAGITLHIKKLSGKNAHHILEGIFKATARALRQAVSLDPRSGGAVPSTKGVI